MKIFHTIFIEYGRYKMILYANLFAVLCIVEYMSIKDIALLTVAVVLMVISFLVTLYFLLEKITEDHPED